MMLEKSCEAKEAEAVGDWACDWHPATVDRCRDNSVARRLAEFRIGGGREGWSGFQDGIEGKETQASIRRVQRRDPGRAEEVGCGLWIGGMVGCNGKESMRALIFNRPGFV